MPEAVLHTHADTHIVSIGSRPCEADREFNTDASNSDPLSHRSSLAPPPLICHSHSSGDTPGCHHASLFSSRVSGWQHLSCEPPQSLAAVSPSSVQTRSYWVSTSFLHPFGEVASDICDTGRLFPHGPHSILGVSRRPRNLFNLPTARRTFVPSSPVVFDKCVVSCIHHDGIVQTGFTALRNATVFLLLYLPLCDPGQPLVGPISTALPFPGCPISESAEPFFFLRLLPRSTMVMIHPSLCVA